MTTTSESNLAQFLADAPGRGFTVRQTSPTTWTLIDAYGDGSTDVHVTVSNTTGRDEFTITNESAR